MKCERCKGDRILEIVSRPKRILLTYKGEEEDVIPDDLPISDRSGKYLKFKICLTCSQAQGMENLPDPEFYTREQEQEDE